MVVILSIHVLAGVALGALWLSHAILAARGMRAIPDITGPLWDANAREVQLPRLSIIVPACNEEAKVGDAVRSLLAILYPSFEVIVVDDRSQDRTGVILDEIAREAGDRLRVIHIRNLPKGWLGKTHAMHVAAQHATGEWLLFTDADIMHRADGVRRAVSYAERVKADHVVVLPTVVMESWGERMMIALFQSLFIFAHRPWKIADPKAKDHIGMGAFNLLRADTYRAIGGYERLRLAVIDDLRLGAAVKRAGFSQRVVFGPELVRVRWAHGLMGVVRNTQKNFFAEFGYSPLLTAAAILGVVVLQLGPWLGVALVHGWAKLAYAVALGCALWVYRGGTGRERLGRQYLLLHPLATVILVYAIARSAVVTLFNRGVVWRGTKYPLKLLRRALDD